MDQLDPHLEYAEQPLLDPALQDPSAPGAVVDDALLQQHRQQQQQQHHLPQQQQSVYVQYEDDGGRQQPYQQPQPQQQQQQQQQQQHYASSSSSYHQPLPGHQPQQHQPPLGGTSSTGKRSYKARCKWPNEDKALLVRTLVEQRNLGQQSGGGFTINAWMAVADALAGSEERSGGDVKGPEECRSAYSRLKREYVRAKQLRSQFLWSEDEQRPDVDEHTKREFLKEHPAYASIFAGWPFYAEMDTINADLPTVASSISKPLQVTARRTSGHGEEEDSHSDSSQSYAHGSSSHGRHDKRRRLYAPPTDPSLEAFSLLPGPNAFDSAESDAVDADTLAAARAGRSGGGGQGANALLWSDMLSEGWSLTEADIVVVLHKFAEAPAIAHHYASLPSLDARAQYLHDIVGGHHAAVADVTQLDAEYEVAEALAQHEAQQQHEQQLDPQIEAL